MVQRVGVVGSGNISDIYIQTARRFPGIAVVACASAVGGGSLPGETLSSFAVALGGQPPDELARRLRQGERPVVGRIAGDRLLLDVRTVLEEQEPGLIEAVRGVLREDLSG